MSKPKAITWDVAPTGLGYATCIHHRYGNRTMSFVRPTAHDIERFGLETIAESAALNLASNLGVPPRHVRREAIDQRFA